MEKKTYQNNLVIGLKGLKGSGKTTILTALLYLAFLSGKKIYSNFWLGFPHEIINIQKMVELDKALQNAVIGISEMHLICDSRRHGKKQNILMSYFVLQSRHRDCDLYYDTQFDNQIDKRIRENTDINIVCENMYVDSDNDGYDDLFRIVIQDRRVRPVRFKQRIIYGKPFFDIFNTKEIVDIFTMKDLIKMKGAS